MEKYFKEWMYREKFPYMIGLGILVLIKYLIFVAAFIAMWFDLVLAANIAVGGALYYYLLDKATSIMISIFTEEFINK